MENIKNRVQTTLFMIESLDGKITTGDSDILDIDSDFSRICGIKEGLHQYYEIEQTTDLYSLNTGRVMAKRCKQLNVNKRKDIPKKMTVSFIIIDNKHLAKNGVEYLLKKSKKLFIITSNKNHPAFKINNTKNLEIIFYPNEIDFKNLFIKLKRDCKIKKLTIQSGGTLNSVLLRNKLIDCVSVVIAPCLIGGKNTSTLIDGKSLHFLKELKHIKALKLKKCKVLEDSYVHLVYDVINSKNKIIK